MKSGRERRGETGAGRGRKRGEEGGLISLRNRRKGHNSSRHSLSWSVLHFL